MDNRRNLKLFLVLGVFAALAAVTACGGGGGSGAASSGSGDISDPKKAPTATPWSQPPDVIYLQDGQLAPLPSSGVPTGEDATDRAPGSCGDTYIVESGDSPSAIAEKCGVDTQDLLDSNPGLNPSNLQIGQELKIPR